MGVLVNLNYTSHAQNLCEGLWKLCREGFKTDFTVAHPKEKSTFSVHHLILTVLLPTFKDVLSKRHTIQENVELRQDDLNLLMEYLYLGKLKVEEGRLPRLKAGAEAMGINSLVKIINIYQQNRKLNVKNINIHVKSQINAADSDDSKPTEAESKSPLDNEIHEEKLVTESNSSDHIKDKKSINNDPKNSSDTGLPKKIRPDRLQYIFDEARNEYVCPTCDKGYKHRDSYGRHLTSHDETAKTHKCSQCHFQTVYWSIYKSHLASIHQLDPQGNVLLKNIKCPQCDFTCVSMFQLKHHNYGKHATKKLTCEECGYSCMNKSALARHMTFKHQNIRAYMCETCGKRFKRNITLKYHERTHTGEKPYECKICDKRFIRPSSLKFHLITHNTSSDRPFPCHICKFASWRKYSLKEHYQGVHKVIFDKHQDFVTWHDRLKSRLQLAESLTNSSSQLADSIT